MDYDDVWMRVKAVTGWKTQEDLASWLGIKQGSVSGAKGRGAFPLEWAYKIAQGYGVSTDWLMTDAWPTKRGEGGAGLDLEEYALVPRYNVEVSAGGGALVEGEAVIGTMAFRREWLKRMGLELVKLALVTTKGDSMEPTLFDGDIVLVDLRQTDITDGAIHVLRNDSGVLVKRLQLGLDNQVIVRSDNRIYSALETTRDKLNVVGRVVWRGGRM